MDEIARQLGGDYHQILANDPGESVSPVAQLVIVTSFLKGVLVAVIDPPTPSLF